MDHFRLRKYRGPEVWARVRLAYEAGESGPSVAQRFDIGLANLRKKCRLEGWSRRHQAERSDRELPGGRITAVAAAADAPPGAGRDPAGDPAAPPEPVEVRRRAVDRAAALLAEGRAAEALTQLKAAEALARLDAAEAGATPEPGEEEFEAVRMKAGQIIEARATELAHEMLAEGVRPGVRWGGYALRWRAQTYGTEAAEADRRTAEAEGWADRYW
ncbi:hypothetical protein, partial [Brevundimonas sp.]|uniref:hypothetical protein n=1 Tax=Brevundimonas sp. TaxID=1871086 RepID=UPI002C63C183